LKVSLGFYKVDGYFEEQKTRLKKKKEKRKKRAKEIARNI
jgi:hypothetical protein